MSLLDYEQYIPIMTAEELNAMARAITDGTPLRYAPTTLASMRERLIDRERELNAKFGKENAKKRELQKG